MFTIISTLFGFLSSVLPRLLQYLEKRQDQKHELEITKIKVEGAVRGIEVNAMAEATKNEFVDGQSARDHDLQSNVGGFSNALRASVRPVVTYVLVLFFLGIKGATFYLLVNQLNIEAAHDKVLDEATLIVISMVVGFWFGQRMWEAKRGKKE